MSYQCITNKELSLLNTLLNSTVMDIPVSSLDEKIERYNLFQSINQKLPTFTRNLQQILNIYNQMMKKEHNHQWSPIENDYCNETKCVICGYSNSSVK
jgi:hypothetical protein